MNARTYASGLVVSLLQYSLLAGDPSPNATNPPPVVTVAASQPNAADLGPTNGTFTITRVGATNASLTVYYALGGSAFNGLDYKMLSGSVTIARGAASADVTVTPIVRLGLTQNTNVTVVMQLRSLMPMPFFGSASYTLGTPSNAVVTIAQTTNATANLPFVTVVATQANASQTGPTNGVFTVARTGSTNAALSVYYQLSGSAANGRDYKQLSGSVTIPAGATNANVTVTPLVSALAYSGTNTTVTLQLRTAQSWWYDPTYNLGSPSNAVVTIAENLTPNVVTVAATQPNASEAGPTNGIFSVARTGATNLSLTVSYSVAGTAFSGVDYKALADSVSIPAGSTSATVTVTPLIRQGLTQDTNVTVVLQLKAAKVSSANNVYTLGSPSNAVVTIAQSTNVVFPVVTVAATQPNASEAGPTPGTFTVTRTGATNASLTVSYSISGTAGNGSDYQRLGNSVVIPAGSIAADIKVMPIVDIDRHPPTNETVVLQLRKPAGLRPGDYAPYMVGSPSNAVVTISELPSNAPPVVIIAANKPVASISTTRTNAATFTVTRSQGTNANLTVAYAISGTASNGIDYVNLPGSVTISNGLYSASIVLTPINSSHLQSNQVLTVILSLPAPAVSGTTPPPYLVGGAGQAAATISTGKWHIHPQSRMAGGLFQLSMPADNGAWLLETSNNLVDWFPLTTKDVTDGVFEFVDPREATAAQGFYRLVPAASSSAGALK